MDESENFLNVDNHDVLERPRSYIRIQALKFRMQALFLMQIQNLNSDFRGFDFLLFLGIKS